MRVPSRSAWNWSMKKRVLESMPTSEALAQARSGYTARTRPEARSATILDKTVRSRSSRDGGKCARFSEVASFSSLRKKGLSNSKRCRSWLSFVPGLPLGAATGGIRQESHWLHSALPHPPHQVQTCAGNSEDKMRCSRRAGGEWKGQRAGRPRSLGKAENKRKGQCFP